MSPNFKVSIPFVIYVVAFCDLFGVSVIIPLLSKHYREIGASPAVSGLIGSIYGGLQLFSSPIIGRWSDSVGRRHVLLWCLLLSAFGYAGLGIATTVTMLFISRIPVGIFKHTQAVLRSYLADTVPHEQHATVFGQVNAAGSVGFIVGPLIGGHMAELPGGFYLIAMTTAFLFILNMVLVWIFVPECHKKDAGSTSSARDGDDNEAEPKQRDDNEAEPKQRDDKEAGPKRRQTKENLIKETKEDEEAKRSAVDDGGFHLLAFIAAFRRVAWTDIWDVFLVRFFIGLAVMVYRGSFALLLDHQYGATPKQVGYIVSYAGVVSALSGVLAGRVAHLYGSTRRLLLHACLLQLGTTLALAYADDLYSVLLYQTPLTLASAVARVAATQMTVDRGRGQHTGTLLGLAASVMSLARMLSPALGGLAQQVSVRGPPLLAAATAGVAVVILATTSHREAPQRKDKTA